MTEPDGVELRVRGRVFGGWTRFRVTRGLDRAAADFDLQVAERWPGRDAPWPIEPFDEVELALGGDPVLTGYVDVVGPAIGPAQREVRVAGRSRTADLVDCMPEGVGGTEFRGSTLPAIARALARPFGIEVVEEADGGPPFGVGAVDREDTAWEAIERLCRMRGLLACDDERGRLVLTRAGRRRAAGALEQGVNVEAAAAELNVSRRYSRYVVLAQRALAAAVAPDGDGDATDLDPSERAGAGEEVAVQATADDPGVPRHRPRVFRAEAEADVAEARQRAVWAAATARGRALRARLRVAGWRQADGRLWRINELVHVRAPWLRLDREMLIVTVTHTLDHDGGRATELVVTPPEAMLPEPIRAPASGTSDRWRDVVPVR